MKRKLLFGERVLFGDGTLPFNGVVTVKIRGVLTLDQLRTALDRLQSRHPMLQAGVQTDAAGLPWYVVHGQVPAIPIHMVERLAEDQWMDVSKTEWERHFDVQRGPLCRLVWLGSPEVSELLLTFHHCLCDGSAVEMLLREFLQLLDEPGLDLGPAEPFFTSVEQLIPQEIVHDKNKIRKAKLQAWVAKKFLALAAAAAGKNTAPGEAYFLHWKWSKAASAALIARCKAEKVTVHAALCTAWLGAFLALKGRKALNKMVCPVDIRKYVPAITKEHIFSFDLAVTLSVSANTGLDFWERARRMQVMLTKKMAALNGYDMLMRTEYLHDALPTILKFLTYGKVSNDMMFSNLGRLNIPDQFNRLQVEDIYSPSAMGPFAPCSGMATSTYRGQMDFCFVSHTSVLSLADAQVLREKAMTFLFAEAPAMQAEPALA